MWNQTEIFIYYINQNVICNFFIRSCPCKDPKGRINLCKYFKSFFQILSNQWFLEILRIQEALQKYALIAWCEPLFFLNLLSSCLVKKYKLRQLP